MVHLQLVYPLVFFLRPMVQQHQVLVEELHKKGRWRGRPRSNKLVFFADEADWRGKLANVRITWAGPWSMIGEVVGSAELSDRQ